MRIFTKKNYQIFKFSENNFLISEKAIIFSKSQIFEVSYFRKITVFIVLGQLLIARLWTLASNVNLILIAQQIHSLNALRVLAPFALMILLALSELQQKNVEQVGHVLNVWSM